MEENNNSTLNERLVNLKRAKSAVITAYVLLVVFVVAFFIISILVRNNTLGSLSRINVRLSEISSEQTIYYVGADNSFYAKDIGGRIVEYVFYESNAKVGVHFGKNLIAGQPPIHYMFPEAIYILIIGLVFFVSLIVWKNIKLYRLREEELFNLEKDSEKFKNNKTRFENAEISIYEYKRTRKELLLEELEKVEKVEES